MNNSKVNCDRKKYKNIKFVIPMICEDILIAESKVSDPDNRLKVVYIEIMSDEVTSEVLISQLFHSVLLYETRNSE